MHLQVIFISIVVIVSAAMPEASARRGLFSSLGLLQYGWGIGVLLALSGAFVFNMAGMVGFVAGTAAMCYAFLLLIFHFASRGHRVTSLDGVYLMQKVDDNVKA